MGCFDDVGRHGVDISVDDLEDLPGEPQQAFDEIGFAVLGVLEDTDVPSFGAEQIAADVVGPFEDQNSVAGTRHDGISTVECLVPSSRETTIRTF